MGQKDLTAKKLEDYKDVFADIVNVLLFRKDYIKPEHLRDGPTESVYKAAQGTLRQQLRDTLKYYERMGVRIADIGIENEAAPEKNMAPRVFGYDAGSYMEQMRKEQPLRPVLTVVLNFSNTRWNQPKSLGRLLDVPEELQPFFQDYRIHVVDIAYLPDETIFQFKSTFRHVAHFFAHMRKDGKRYKPLDEEIEHLEEFLEVLQVFTKDETYQKIAPELIKRQRKGERISMCVVVDTFTNRGIEIGRKEGRREGRKEGRKEGREEERLRLIRNLVQGTEFTVKQAMEALKIPKSERKRYEELLKNGTAETVADIK